MTYQPGDDDLFARFRMGDPKALETIYHKYFNALCFFAYSIIHDTAESQDIVIEVYIKLWDRRERFNNLDRVRGFLFTSCKNAGLDYLRKSDRGNSSLNEFMYIEANSETQTFLEEVETNFMHLIYEAIEGLPGNCKKVFKLYIFDGLTIKEIAEMLKLSPSTVQNHKQRAQSLIRSKFDDLK